jgi:mannose-6-phosphate isomerase-like protein (cupin superfamily)
MKVFHAADLATIGDAFKVLASTDRSQLAIMNLAPDETSGEYGNEHGWADQWLLVLEGGGRLKVEDTTVDLKPGDVAVIPAGAKHQVIGPQKSVSIYAPVAYDASGEPARTSEKS